MLHCARRAFKNWRADDDHGAVKRTKTAPRSAPASLDQVQPQPLWTMQWHLGLRPYGVSLGVCVQVKLGEGLFEALPQAILQTLLAVKDILSTSDLSRITALRGISLVMSYLSLAGALAKMGERVQTPWRVTFFCFVLSQALMRGVSLTYFRARFQNDDVWVFWLYLVGTFLATVFFNIVVQRKRFNATNMLSTFIALIVPVDLKEFTVLKSAKPRAVRDPLVLLACTTGCSLLATYRHGTNVCRAGAAPLLVRAPG